MANVKVCCAVLFQNNKVLAVQRAETMSNPLKWEFPGGKIKAGEKEEECIKREIKEELGLTIKAKERLESNVHPYSESLQIELIPFLCEITDGSLELAEHKAHLWLNPFELETLDWSEADLPIVKTLASSAQNSNLSL